jgi:hypothetical protein
LALGACTWLTSTLLMVCIGHVPLEHAIYDRADTNLGLPEVRIIGASPRPRWLDVLLCTGERVRVVASSPSTSYSASTRCSFPSWPIS